MKKSFISPWMASGFVSNTRESWKAAQLARNVKGVKAVRNDLAVK